MAQSGITSTTDSQTHSALNMAARSSGNENDPNTATLNTALIPLAASAAMSSEGNPAFAEFDLSLSPIKNDEDTEMKRRRQRQQPGAPRPRSSSAAAGVKRSSSEPIERSRPGPAGSPWTDDPRAVHRRVHIDPTGPVNNSLKGIGEQLDTCTLRFCIFKGHWEAVGHLHTAFLYFKWYWAAVGHTPLPK